LVYSKLYVIYKANRTEHLVEWGSDPV